MPVGWRVQTDFTTKPELSNRRYDFVSTDPRDVALRKLTSSIRDARVRFQYFWDLTDASGNPAPMAQTAAAGSGIIPPPEFWHDKDTLNDE